MASLTETSSFPFGDWIFPSTYWSPTWPLREVPEPAIIIPLEWIFSSSASPTEDRPKSYFQIPITDVSILNVLVTGLNLNHKTKTHYYCCLNSRGTYTLSGSRPLAGTPTWPGCPWPARWSRSKTAMPSSSPAASLWSSSASQAPRPSSVACPPARLGPVYPHLTSGLCREGRRRRWRGWGWAACRQVVTGDQLWSWRLSHSGGDGGAQARGQEPRSAWRTPPQRPSTDTAPPRPLQPYLAAPTAPLQVPPALRAQPV